MSLRSAWQVTAGMVFAQLEGPKYAFDLPSFRKLIVDCTELTAPTEEHPEGTIVFKGVAPRHMSYGDFNDAWKITIDRKTGYIDDADWHVIMRKHGENDKWGFLSLLFGLPGIIVCLPLLLPWWGVRRLTFKLTGLDVHQQALFAKMRPQLTGDLQVTFLKALRNQRAEGLWAYRAAKEQLRKERKGKKNG